MRPFIAVCLLAVGAPARGAETVEHFDQRVGAELAAASPEAGRLWTEANSARQSDPARAGGLYARIEALVPTSPHAFRRHCGTERALQHPDEAVALCRKALELERSAHNLTALASVLGSRHGPADLAEGSRLIEEALRLGPDDPNTLVAAAQLAMASKDLPAMQRHAKALLRVQPEEAGSWYLGTLDALVGRDFDEAQRRLDRARALGLPAGPAGDLQTAIDRNRPWTDRWLPRLAQVFGLWLAALVVLVALGWVLSRLALRAAARRPDETSGRAVGLGGALRRLYAAVLWLACAYYYVSIPLVLLLVLGAGGGIVYGFFALGHIPVKLVLVVAFLVLFTLWAVLRSLFVRGRDQDPGRRLDLEKHPRLAAVLQEVARKVGTRPVDSVFLVPGTDLAVFERGGVLRQMRGMRERCLILGAGALEGMAVAPFKAILAHEYGHLSNEDTAGGGFALAVRRSLLAMAQRLAEGGAAAWYNPAWLFLNGFYRVFLRISQGASRLQEVLADRWAAFSYGAAAFEAGLRHVIDRSVRFDAHVNGVLRDVVEGDKRLLNLYRCRPSAPPDEGALAKAVEQAIGAEPSPYDSHPSPADRFAWVHALPGAPAGADERGLAWDLLEDREALERSMTDEVRANLALNHGIALTPEAGQGEGGAPAQPAPTA